MANLKISQLPSAANLTGAELVEMDQAGVSVQSTVTAIGAQVASPPIIQGAVKASLGSLGMNVGWTMYTPNIAGTGPVAFTTLTPSLGNMNTPFGAPSLQALTPSAATLAAAVQMTVMTSSAIASQAAALTPPTFGGSTPSFAIGGGTTPATALVRGLANGIPVGGFTMTLYFTLRLTTSTEQIFFGFQGTGSPAVGNTNTPSAFLNAIALTRDSADTNLQFLISSSTAFTKLDLGVTHTSVANKMLRLVITCDGFGNVTLTLTNMEAGGGQIASVSYPTNTANLPILQSGSGTIMSPLWYINNGGAAVAVSFGMAYCFITVGFGSS